jgi:hypothetical protein
VKITLEITAGQAQEFDVDFMKRNGRIVAIVAPIGPGGITIDSQAVCGVAKCSEKDNYDQLIGKRLALQRFIDIVGWSELWKKVLWDAFVLCHVKPSMVQRKLEQRSLDWDYAKTLKAHRSEAETSKQFSREEELSYRQAHSQLRWKREDEKELRQAESQLRGSGDDYEY